ncbi:MAG TPA: molecular chaperone [Buttiauxella sp.]|jgi:P pilus assembly chaperone PapD
MSNKLFFLIFLSVFSSDLQASGLTLNATRLIYQGNMKEASVMLRNNIQDTPHLIQSWVSVFNGDEVSGIPFITTPPLFKLASESEMPVRVVYIGSDNSALKDDRESLFLLNIRAIPAVEKMKNPARLTIATQNIIKLIYRPKGLSQKDASEAGEKLKITAKRKEIIFKNPTPYVVTLTSVTIDGQKIERGKTILPYSSQNISVQASEPRVVSWSTINDWGGITPLRTIKL